MLGVGVRCELGEEGIFIAPCPECRHAAPVSMTASSDSKFTSRSSGALLVLTAAALWSTGGVGVKVADAEPLVIAGLRSAFALVFMLLVVGVQFRKNLGLLVTLLRRPLVWAAAVSYAVTVVFFVLAARRTTAANAIFIQYTAPIYVALLSGPLLGEKPRKSDFVAIGACLAGMALTFGGELGAGRVVGNLFAVLSSFGFAGLPLFLRIDQKHLDPTIASRAPLVAMTLGNALAALVATESIVSHFPSGANQTRTLLVLFLLGAFQIGLPYLLYGVAIRRLRALESSLLATLEPVLSPIWVLLATGEKPSPMAMVGGGVILAAVVLQSLMKRGGADVDEGGLSAC